LSSDECRQQIENDDVRGKTLRDGIPNGLLRDRTGVEDIENHLGETRLRWLRHFDRMDETNLVKRVREERVPGHMKRKRLKKSWGEVVKEDMKKRGLYVNDAQDKNKWRRFCRKWSTSFNWEEDPAIKAERRLPGVIASCKNLEIIKL